MGEAFDYIIVGAGSAGCVLANRLTADGRHSVCLLEAGPSDWNPYIHIPAVSAIVGTRFYTAFVTLLSSAPSGIRGISGALEL